MIAPGAETSELPAGMGARLKRERERLGLTEQQAAEQLNLDPTVIHALETDDYAALGVAVFAKGHLRRYGALLAVPDDELVDAFEHSRAQLPQPTLVPKSREEMLPGRTRPKAPWVIGSAVLFLLAAAIIAYVSEYGLGLPGRGAAATQPAAVDGAPPPMVAGPGEVTAAPEQQASGTAPEGSGADAGAPDTAALRPGQVSLQLSFTADSWVEIYDGSGKAVLYDLGQAGTQRAVVATAPLSVTFGNAPAVTLHVNGRAMAVPLPPAGQTVARFSIGPDGSSR